MQFCYTIESISYTLVNRAPCIEAEPNKPNNSHQFRYTFIFDESGKLDLVFLNDFLYDLNFVEFTLANCIIHDFPAFFFVTNIRRDMYIVNYPTLPKKDNKFSTM